MKTLEELRKEMKKEKEKERLEEELKEKREKQGEKIKIEKEKKEEENYKLKEYCKKKFFPIRSSITDYSLIFSIISMPVSFFLFLIVFMEDEWVYLRLYFYVIILTIFIWSICSERKMNKKVKKIYPELFKK